MAVEPRRPTASALPLATLLSHVLVAFTIEFDNEFEHRTPHRTTVAGASGGQSGPWLTSMVMYSNLLRLVPERGISVREIIRLSRTPMVHLAGMERWGYIVVAPDPADTRPKPPQADWLVRPSARGLRAQQAWEPLFGEIEERWQNRFGAGALKSLRAALSSMVGRIDLDLPEYLPVLGYGLTAEVLDVSKPAPDRARDAQVRTLPALLSNVLLALTLEFERQSAVSLAICANVLRVFDGEPIKVRDLPRLSGVSKEAIAVATGFLRARGYAAIEADSGARRGKVVRLTPAGTAARDTYARLLGEIEADWQTRFGEANLHALRDALERLTKMRDGEELLLFKGMEPYADNWRAKVPRPDTLPHYPMVLHRGGYPDGS